MSREEVGPEYPGEGAIHAIYSRVFSQVRFWEHTKKCKKAQKCVLLTHQKNEESANQVLVWNLKLLLPSHGGRVEIGLPCITSKTGGPLINQAKKSLRLQKIPRVHQLGSHIVKLLANH